MSVWVILTAICLQMFLMLHDSILLATSYSIDSNDPPLCSRSRHNGVYKSI